MMNVLSIVLQSILGLGFLMFGLGKFGKQMKEEFNRYQLSPSMRIFTGLVEIASAIIVIIGTWEDPYAAVGGILIGLVLLLALVALYSSNAERRRTAVLLSSLLLRRPLTTT